MNRRKLWTFRLLALLTGLSVFVAFELLCRFIGWGADSAPTTALAELTEVRPLFALSADRDRWEIAANRRMFFAEDSFPAQKSDRDFRIFVLGGSTVQGRPFSTPTSFATFLEIALQTVDPTTNWQVVNCGGISYASYRLQPILEECLQQHQPDLIVLCTGHNEFLERMTISAAGDNATSVVQGYQFARKLHSFRFVEQLFTKAPAPAVPPVASPLLPAEVDAMLDHQGGLDAYRRTALHRNTVEQRFDRHVRDMLAMTQKAGVPLLMVLPPSNLRDCPPFKSEFSDTTSPEDRQTILKALRAETNHGTPPARTLQQITTIDEQFAHSWYALGQALIRSHQVEEAKAALRRARDEDVCPLRMTSALETIFLAVADETDTPLLDAHDLLATRARDGIPGSAVLVDHVHPSFTGNQDIAMVLIQILHALDILKTPLTPTQKAACQSAFDAHLQSLDNLYFLRGRRTIQTLQAWTQGRADGPPLEE